jgi:hypothetical protein
VNGSLGDRLRAVEVPDEDGARERAKRVVLAGFERRAPSPRRSRLRLSLAPSLAAAAVALVLVSFTSPGQAVIDSVRDSLGRVEVREAKRPALDRLPAPGSLLVRSPEGMWVVRGDGSKRLLGPYLDATWSPFGRFVGVTRANALLAVEPGGRVHWSLSRPRVSRPRWAPSGFRVAYVSGRDVRVVAGDGTGDRLVRRGVAAEWRPGGGSVQAVGGQKVLAGVNVLAVARPDGRIETTDVDTRRTLWVSRPLRGRVRAMSWSSGGRVLVATARGVSVLDDVGRVTRTIAAGQGAVLVHAAFAPGGERIAIVRRRGPVSELVFANARGGGERLRFAGSGTLGDVVWSPDGKWVLVGWPDADQFLFLPASGRRDLQAATGVAREFDPRARSVPAVAPRPLGWK